MGEVGRVLIAFDDPPLEPSPTWTRIDGAGDFPDQFVSGFDTENGKQTLLDVTGTGTGTVYLNDHQYGLFDPRNTSSPYHGKLTASPILLQLYDPVRDVWEPQFRGTIDNISYDIDGSAVNADGDPINASLQINCVDIFDFLAGFGLTPGYAGVKPVHLPPGTTNGVWYGATSGELFGRIWEILLDIGLDPTDNNQCVIFSGNVAIQAVKYDPDTPALTALRDAVDAEFPCGLANMYCDRYGRFVFHGRYGRFDPAAVHAQTLIAYPGYDPPRWNFHWWYAGDGKAIQADSSRAQLRALAYEQGRDNVINIAVAYPANSPNDQIPFQVYADTGSITAFGHHPAPPMGDLLTGKPINDNLNGHPSWTRYDETLKYAELLVKNQKDAHEWITTLNFKSLTPVDTRAPATWALLSQVDVSDVINVAVGYPGGTGLVGGHPNDDYFVEGRKQTVRPLQPGYDYVELELSVSPFSMTSDIHGVFPAYGGGT